MSAATPLSAVSATGKFQSITGQIIGPDGQPFIAKGINIGPSQMGDAQQILADFPGINFIRLAVDSYGSPSSYSSFIQTMSAHGVVVEIEDHTIWAGSEPPYTGSQLATETAWYSSLASAYASNPYVWLGTENEPGLQNGVSAVSDQHVAIYNAIRNTGNTNMVMLELPGGGEPNTIGAAGGMITSDYTNMTNVAFDIHYYGWISGFSTNQTTVNADLKGSVSSGSGTAAAQSMSDAQGSIPVIIGEYGPSTDGTNTDQDGDQVLSAVQNSGFGSAAWAYDPGQNDVLVNPNGSLTSFGQEVADWIASTTPIPTPSPTPTPTPTPTSPPSPDDTVVPAGSTSAITDASGNRWTLTNGAVQENGQAAGYSANVTELAYVNGSVWQENASGLWWQWNGNTWAGNGTSTSPLPATPTPTPTPVPTPTPAPTPTPSPDNTVITGTTSGQIVDASGNVWTLTAAGKVAVNGVTDTTTANVIELAYEKGEVWQENAADLWWGKTSPTASWAPSAGTSTSPVPTAPVPSPNDTVVVAGSIAAITDASGNAWTIVSGVVDMNGAAAGYSSGVHELAYVNGNIWQENTSNLWWEWNGSDWGSGAGTSTSPLPTMPTPTPVPTPAPTPTPSPTPTPAIDVTTAAGVSTLVNGQVTGTTHAAGATFTLTAPGVATVALGATADTLHFISMTSVSVTGGSAASTLVANGGANTFKLGRGAMDVTGGAGADSYVIGRGAGALTVEDFSAAKGDSLTIAKTLKGSMHSGSDGQGGTVLSFSGAGSVDLKHVASVPTAAIHWG